MNNSITTILIASMCFLAPNLAAAQWGAATAEISEDLDTEIVSGGTDKQHIEKAIDGNGGDGVRAISTPSGVGFVATATAYYSYSKNVDLTRVAQRAAAVNALYSAKYKLAEFLFGCSVEGQQVIAESFEILMSDDGTLMNTGLSQGEEVESAVYGLICGAVIYDFVDEPGESSGAVMVSIVTTPGTRGEFSRGADQSVMHARTIESASAFIEGELKMGLTPPNGGRTIVLADGSMAWVGFGSGLLIDTTGRSPMAAKASKNKAKTDAALRAKASLFTIIKGEKISGWDKMAEEFTASSNEFETLMDDEGGESIQAMQAAEESMYSASGTQSVVSAEFGGDLPPGCMSFDVSSRDGHWVTTCYVYSPNITAGAKQAAKAMESTPFMNAKPTGAGYQTNSDGSFKRDENGKVIPVSLGSGRVTSDKDL
jgi:hypothetical protein